MMLFREELWKVWNVISGGNHAARAKPLGVDMEGIRQDVLCSGNAEKWPRAKGGTWELAVHMKLDFIL